MLKHEIVTNTPPCPEDVTYWDGIARAVIEAMKREKEKTNGSNQKEASRA